MKATMRKRSGCLVSMAVGVMLATAGDSSWAQGVESSSWNSQYGDNQGSFKVDAQLQLQGQSGAYFPSGGYGNLSGITYRPSSTGGTLVSGNWMYANSQGWFDFDVTSDGARFFGSWGYGRRNGQPPVGFWTGWRNGGGAPAPVPVPYP